MANPVFPTLALTNGGQDSSKFKIEPEDPAMVSEMEGGYMVSRARHTRRPRLTFSTAYKEISDADRKTILDFYQDMGGGARIFDWTDPVDGVTYQVRFTGKLDIQYVGIGVSKLWNVGFQLVQA